MSAGFLPREGARKTLHRERTGRQDARGGYRGKKVHEEGEKGTRISRQKRVAQNGAE